MEALSFPSVTPKLGEWRRLVLVLLLSHPAAMDDG
jgi:hypothetical protein